MININKLLQEIVTTEKNYTHKDMSYLLKGVKGKFSRADIKRVKALINNELTQVIKTLNKLENEN